MQVERPFYNIHMLYINFSSLYNFFIYSQRYKIKLKKIPQDNIEIKNKGSLNYQKNFLCDVRGYEFVDEFVPHYFKVFDSQERQSLKGKLHY